MTLKSIFFLLTLSLLVYSCKSDPLDVNAKNVDLELNFINMDSTIVNSDSLEFIKVHEAWKKNIEELYNYELGYCLHIGDVAPSETYSRIQVFLQDKYISRLEDQISKTFASAELNKQKLSIRDGFKHLKYHLPNSKMPSNIVFMNSLFTSNVFCTESEIGIGMERYLGEKAEVIQELPEHEFYDWIKKAMDKQYLDRDVLTGWISTHVIDETSGSLAEHIIRWGKVIYLTEAAFPDKEDRMIIRYSKEDYKWAQDNEYAFWQYLVNENLLFKTNDLNVTNMINEGPFTPGLPEKGPDRLGQYLGWRMVKQYVEKNGIQLEKLNGISYNDILQSYEIE